MLKTKSRTLDNLVEQNNQRLERMADYIDQGVNIVDPATTYIAPGVVIGPGTVIYPLSVIEENVAVGKDCSIGPFARIRKGSVLKDSVVVGNFVEVNRSTISEGSKVKHLTYLGDTLVEEKVNIGAGTIVANYDGKNKHKTTIKKGAFIGSGSILVAPLKIGESAVTGAGAVVTKNKDVPDKTTVVGVPARPLKRGV